jgi:anti-sigma factor RsiW
MNHTMTCADAQDRILQRLDGLLPDADGAAVDAHIAGCDDCAHFELQQLDLDRRLETALPPVTLGADFRDAVRARIADASAQAKQPWLEMMPDYAHLIGCAAAIAVCLVALPAYAWTILTVGGAVTACTYVAQTLLLGAMDELDERRPAPAPAAVPALPARVV